VWAALLAFAVFAYVVMDGFDLGVGILFPFVPPGEGRDRSMNSIAPVCDGNETWLVLGGVGLFAAFPLAYAVIMPAVYAIIAMLLGLVFRGVAFEYRWRTIRGRWAWDLAFFGGSLLAAFSQGVILGAILQGIKVAGRAYAGGWWDWLSPFSLLTGASLVIGYALLGSTWLYLKTEGHIQERARQLSFWLAGGMVTAIAAVSAATPFLDAQYAQRWFAWPGVLLVAQVPLLVVVVSILLFLSLRARRDAAPFLLSLALFALGGAGLVVTVYPYVVPVQITIWQAASQASSLGFRLVGAGLGYQGSRLFS
jgi:cytochrome d ubiquinol oxidase subunit II